MAAEGRNCRAFGDANIQREAKLLANAQAAPADKKNKKPIAANVDRVAANGAIPSKVVPRKPAQKKATVKPKPETVIVIRPDTKEKVKKKKSLYRKAAKDSSRKTYTATLTARSKAACGLDTQPKEKIQDIDAGDVNNELAVVEYVEDIYKFYKEAENETRVHDYMDSQPEINERMRAIVIDWLIEVNLKFELTSETLYLTINIFDRYLALRTTSKRELQLVGITAILIASKYEEIWAPDVSNFAYISHGAYTHEQVLEMEKRILGELEWCLTVPTPYMFLVRFIKAAAIIPPDSAMENMVHFLAELGMMNYATIAYCPSMIAASVVYVARCTLLDKTTTPAWNETLKVQTGFSEAQLMDCAKLLVNYHLEAANHELQVFFKKYSDTQMLPPAKFLLAAAAPP